MLTPSFRQFARTASGMALVAIIAGACASPAPSPVATSPQAGSPAPSAVIVTASPSSEATTGPVQTANPAPLVGIFVTKFGQVLEIGGGRMLYVHAGDSATASTCLDDCATAWPPFTIVPGATVISPPGAHGPFASITRPDGSLQVTYKGKPLYFWKGDVNPGDTTGQGINGFTVAAP